VHILKIDAEDTLRYRLSNTNPNKDLSDWIDKLGDVCSTLKSPAVILPSLPPASHKVSTGKQHRVERDVKEMTVRLLDAETAGSRKEPTEKNTFITYSLAE